MTIHSAVIQKLLSTNAHMGRRVAEHHFKIYSAGQRNAMTIIDSDKTLICMRNACNFIANLVRNNGRFLFVNTNSLFDEIITQMTKSIGCKNDTSWRLGGFLTNSSSPKKFRGRNKKFNLGAVQPPDCVVIFDTERKSSVILEADKLQIPVVGLVDSSMPWDIYKRITYPVPANDSVQFVYLFCNLITKTILYEHKRLGSALGDVAAKPVTRDDIQQIEKSSKDQIFVLPYESLEPFSEDAKELLDKLVVLKFNSSPGTKMGFNGPKSTIEVCSGLTCLDLVINQIESLNLKHGCNIPLLLANTIHTHEGVLKALEKHPNKNIYALLQSPPKQDNSHISEPMLSRAQKMQGEMFPSSLGEFFFSLKNSGNLYSLLSQGKEYILVVNSDNLAQFVDPKILNHLIQNNIDHCMEVMPTSPETIDSHGGKFQPKESVRFTDTMWMSMNSVELLLQRSDLREDSSFSKIFDRAFAVNVPKSRYLPIETTSDLLLFQSDLYTFDEGTWKRNMSRTNPADPSIELGPEFENVSEFRNRFKSIPSIVELDSLKVTGDVWFGAGITLKGKVSILARPGMRITIPDGITLENKVISSPSDSGSGSS